LVIGVRQQAEAKYYMYVPVDDHDSTMSHQSIFCLLQQDSAHHSGVQQRGSKINSKIKGDLDDLASILGLLGSVMNTEHKYRLRYC